MASSPDINAWNEQWRSSPEYRQILASVGADPNGPLRLTDQQRKMVQAALEQSGVSFEGGLEIDPAGNLNEDEGWSKHKSWIIPAAIGVGTLGVGALGAGPAAGLFGGSSAAGGGASMAGLPALGNVNAITSALGGGGGGFGGILSAIGNGAGALSSLGGVLGGAARGSADQRMREGDSLVRQQQLLQQGSRDQFTAGLQGAQFAREGQDRERKAAILMQLLNNTQDSNITPGNPAIAARMGTSTGGARPSNLTANREALMALLQQPQTQAPTYTPPPNLRLPTAGAGENLLGGIGLGSSILGALGALRQPQRAY
jgi:hypothetical protein